MDKQDSLLTINEAYNEFFANIERDSFADISNLGRWRLSSAKGEFGLARLLEHDPSTYWQSDGDLPHFVEIQFSKQVDVSMVGLFTDFSLDESYTPQRVHVYAGFGRYNMVKVHSYELSDADGWSCMMLDQQGPQHNRPLQCNFLRIEITKNFQNGKDSHIRGLRVVGPRRHNSDQSIVGMGFRRL